MFVILFCLFHVIDGVPLAKLHNSSSLFGGTSLAKNPSSDLMSKILSSSDNNEVLVSVLADADPVALNQIITLLKELLTTSQNELDALVSDSSAADTAFTNAYNAHNAAIVDQTNGIISLNATRDSALQDANNAYEQGAIALQDAVDAAKLIVDSTNSTKITNNALLDADRDRLTSEISTLTTVINMMEGVLGINTVSPTSSPTAPQFVIVTAMNVPCSDAGYSKITTVADCEAAANALGVQWNSCCQNINNEPYGCLRRNGQQGNSLLGDILFNGKVDSATPWGPG